MDFSGYDLTAAYDISPNGESIVGEAIHSASGAREGFLVTVPEPSFALTTAAGIVSLAAMSRPRG